MTILRQIEFVVTGLPPTNLVSRNYNVDGINCEQKSFLIASYIYKNCKNCIEYLLCVESRK